MGGGTGRRPDWRTRQIQPVLRDCVLAAAVRAVRGLAARAAARCPERVRFLKLLQRAGRVRARERGIQGLGAPCVSLCIHLIVSARVVDVIDVEFPGSVAGFGEPRLALRRVRGFSRLLELLAARALDLSPLVLADEAVACPVRQRA